VNTGFWWADLRQRDHFEDLGLGERIILKWIFRKCVGEALAELIWLKIRTGGGPL
jgi:hypothetical protein